MLTRSPLLLLLLAACSQPASPTTRVAISVAPLHLPDLSDVGWTLSVTNADGATLWSKTLASARYGTGDGALAYVGPCDADANPNTVTLTLASLTDADGVRVPTSDYVTPPPLTQTITCIRDADVAATFDVTVARAANQGFFDVAVAFSDIFCSAKLDCVDDMGEPLTLLHDGDTRSTTIVAGLACTSGAGTPTWLHMNDMVLTCSDGTRIVHNPARGPGNVGGDDGPYVFQRAVYRGTQQREPYDACYWNQAFGLALDAIPDDVSCTLGGEATASEGAWPTGSSPAGAIYPVIRWSTPVITRGALTCGRHALGEGPEVHIDYVGPEATRFAYSMACEDAHAAPNGTVCGGALPGFADAVVFAATGEGVVLAVGDQVTEPMRLPPGVALANDCCMDPCCSE